MALLEVRGLTMRFGGLTAVSKVDFSVEKGQIFSIIGPNGAGKTTVFNAVTGLYEPTEGDVRFEGRDLRSPFRLGVALFAAFIGLFAAASLAILSANVDSLWRAAINLNYADRSEPFPVRKAWEDARKFLRADVMIECEWNKLIDLSVKKVEGKYVVWEPLRKIPLETHATKDAAKRRVESVYSMVILSGSLRTTRRADGRWYLVTPTREFVGSYAREEDARNQVQALRDLPGAEKVEENGKYFLRAGGRVVSPVFDYPHEPDDYRDQMAFAVDASVESGAGKWFVFAEDGKTLLDVFESREMAKARLLELAVKAGRLMYRLKTRASKEMLTLVFSPDEAEREARALDELLDLRDRAPIEEREGKTVILSADRTRVLQTCADRKEAEERRAFLSSVGAARSRDRVLLWVTFLVGLAIGSGGTLVYWHRARRTPDVVSLQGLARTFQNIRLFHEMTVLENVLVGMDRSFRAGVPQQMIRSPWVRKEERRATVRAMEILRFVGLEGAADSLARNLPYGHQRRLEIARAMATQPRLLLLDEPAAGMNPTETGDLMELIRRIRDRGITVLVIEHHMKLVMGISDRIIVLDHGVKIAEGTAAEVKKNRKVIEAYLGREESHS